jgi:hypothetical protein
MLTWLAFKKILKKVWTWIKHYWYAPAVVIYTLVLWLVFRKRDSAAQVLDVRSQSYKDQIDVINKSHSDEIEKRDEIIKKYIDVIGKLEEEHKIKKEELDDKKKKEVKKIVEEYHNKPDELARMLAEKYGLTYEE